MIVDHHLGVEIVHLGVGVGRPGGHHHLYGAPETNQGLGDEAHHHDDTGVAAHHLGITGEVERGILIEMIITTAVHLLLAPHQYLLCQVVVHPNNHTLGPKTV